MSTQMKWSQKLIKNGELRTKGALLLWERTNLLVEVYEDEEFRLHCLEVIKRNPEDRLDDDCDDTGFSFLDLMSVMKRFPEKEQWEDKHPKRLLAQIIADGKEKRRKENPTERPRPSKKELEELARELTAAKAQVNTIKADREEQVQSLQQRYEVLRRENQELTRKLSHAEGRIAELERVVSRELAAGFQER